MGQNLAKNPIFSFEMPFCGVQQTIEFRFCDPDLSDFFTSDQIWLIILTNFWCWASSNLLPTGKAAVHSITDYLPPKNEPRRIHREQFGSSHGVIDNWSSIAPLVGCCRRAPKGGGL